jgi:hypothetical protein
MRVLPDGGRITRRRRNDQRGSAFSKALHLTQTMTAHAQDVFDPTAYPRTYRLSVGNRLMVSVVGLVLLGLGGVFFSLLSDVVRWPGTMPLFVVCGAFASLGIYVLAASFFYRVTLQADSIQVFDIHQRRSLARSEIEGRSHSSEGQVPAGWILVPIAGAGRKIQLSRFLKTDKDFLTWIRSLPDLDLGRKRATEKERTEAIASLKKRGFSAAGIQRLRHVARGLNLSVYVFGLASLLIPDPDHVLTWVMVALPWCTILLVAYFKPYYRFGGPRNSPLPDLTLALITPGLFLTLRALQGIAPVGWEGSLLLTVLGSAALVGVAFWFDPWLKQHRGTAVLLMILGCGYGYGAGMIINALLDESTPRTYQVLVTAKHISRGRGTSYHLQLAAWGPKVGGQEVLVSSSRYSVTKVGDTVCMVLKSGALGVPWSALGGCGDRG